MINLSATLRLMLFGLGASVCVACSSPLMPYTTEGPPLAMMPVALAGIEDDRGRFREIFCAVLEARGDELPDYQPCQSALTLVGVEPEGEGNPVDLGMARNDLTIAFVPGVGWGCVQEWLESSDGGEQNLRRFGYESVLVEVDALSSSANNARQIRDFVQSYTLSNPDRELILAGYSKGAPDILRAVVDYPEIRQHITAVMSVAGSIGGSALANNATQAQLELLTHWPEGKCDAGDGEGLHSLKPQTRRMWMAENPLPDNIAYYSVVTYPDPKRISSVLKSSWRKLAKIDARNDSQVIFYDQLVPDSTLLAYLNADHWAVAVPVGRTHNTLRKIAVTQNNYPREAMLEALVRYVDDTLERQR